MRWLWCRLWVWKDRVRAAEQQWDDLRLRWTEEQNGELLEWMHTYVRFIDLSINIDWSDAECLLMPLAHTCSSSLKHTPHLLLRFICCYVRFIYRTSIKAIKCNTESQIVLSQGIRVMLQSFWRDNLKMRSSSTLLPLHSVPVWVFLHSHFPAGLWRKHVLRSSLYNGHSRPCVRYKLSISERQQQCTVWRYYGLSAESSHHRYIGQNLGMFH